MRWIVMVLLMAVCILTLIAYAVLVIASEEDERAERMYIEWKEERDDGRRTDKETE